MCMYITQGTRIFHDMIFENCGGEGGGGQDRPGGR